MGLEHRSADSERDTSSISKLPDAALLERFTMGRDEAAFAEIVRRHGPVVWQVCGRVVRHQQDAEDAFQATFLALVQQAESIEKRDSLRSWLQGVARRIAMKAVRTRHRRLRFLDRLLESREGVAARPAHDEELWNIVTAELKLLPERQRAVLEKCVMEGRSYRQAAEELGIPVSTVASHMRRGRQSLKKRLTARGLCAAGTVLTTRRLPAALRAATVKNASSLVAGDQGALPVNVVALMKGAIASMSKAAKTLLAVTLVCTASWSTWWLSAKDNTPVHSTSPVAAATPQPGMALVLDVQAVPGWQPQATFSTPASGGPSVSPSVNASVSFSFDK